VEMHLDECITCQGEYESLKFLSAALQDVPLPDFPSPEDFAANLALRLPRKPVTPMRDKALEVGWWLAPIGLIAVWIFISTTNLVSGVLTTANILGILTDTSAWLASGSAPEAYWSATLGEFGFLTGNNLQWAEMAEAITRTTIPQIVWQVSIATLYLSWMAIWWVRHTRQGLGQPLES
jgi:hypothetical protein